MVTGGSSIYEKYVPEGEYLSEAGATGKIGNFSITNNGVMVDVDRVRFIMRSPLDRLQQIVAQSWSWSGDFPVPSDLLEGGNSRYKRSIVVEHAV